MNDCDEIDGKDNTDDGGESDDKNNMNGSDESDDNDNIIKRHKNNNDNCGNVDAGDCLPKSIRPLSPKNPSRSMKWHWVFFIYWKEQVVVFDEENYVWPANKITKNEFEITKLGCNRIQCW